MRILLTALGVRGLSDWNKCSTEFDESYRAMPSYGVESGISGGAPLSVRGCGFDIARGEVECRANHLREKHITLGQPEIPRGIR